MSNRLLIAEEHGDRVYVDVYEDPGGTHTHRLTGLIGDGTGVMQTMAAHDNTTACRPSYVPGDDWVRCDCGHIVSLKGLRAIGFVRHTERVLYDRPSQQLADEAQKWRDEAARLALELRLAQRGKQ